MKPLVTLLLLASTLLQAELITLSEKETANWKIETELPQKAKHFPLGEAVAEVTTAPSALRSISLPFEAHIGQLHVAPYQQVDKGDLLAEITGSHWISAQQEAIADWIAFKQQEETASRNSALCVEGVLPQKECIAAEGSLNILKFKSNASQAMLESYGASPQMINTLFQNLKLIQTLPVVSPFSGTVKRVNGAAGETIGVTESLFVIQQKEALRLESRLERIIAQQLTEGETVTLTFDNQTFNTRVLSVSAIVAPSDQTRMVRFKVPQNQPLLIGTKESAKLTLHRESYQVPVSAVITIENHPTLFLKKPEGYLPVTVTLLGESKGFYYLSADTPIDAPVVTSSLAIFKNLAGEDDE